MFENANLHGMSAKTSALGLSQGIFRAAYREVRKAINVHDADNDYKHYRHTEQLPDYVLAFMDGDFVDEGIWRGMSQSMLKS